MSNSDYDAIVIGAGIIGGCVALSLARRGWRTLNVDRLPAAGYGSTGASCAIIRLHYSTREGCAMAWEGYQYWKDWAGYIGTDDERGLALFNDVGCMVLKTEGNDHLRAVCRNMDAFGIEWQDWDRDAVLARMPFYDLQRFAPARRPDDEGFGMPTGGEIAGAVFFPNAGYISDPQLATHNVQRAAEAAGGEFRFGAEVVSIERTDGRVGGVTLAGGERITAPIVINVAGPHSAKVNRMAGVEDGMRVKTRALRQEVCHIPAPPGIDYEHHAPVTSDNDIGCYGRPEVGNYILVGSEDPECDPREWVDPDDYDRNFSEQWRVQALRYAQRIPTLGVPEHSRGVVDLYDVSDDWIPIYDRSDLDGFYMAVGSSGNQFKNAPVAGELMADLIERCEAGHDHDREPLTITLPRTGIEIDTGFCSRLREINPASSFSVLG